RSSDLMRPGDEHAAPGPGLLGRRSGAARLGVGGGGGGDDPRAGADNRAPDRVAAPRAARRGGPRFRTVLVLSAKAVPAGAVDRSTGGRATRSRGDDVAER